MLIRPVDDGRIDRRGFQRNRILAEKEQARQVVACKNAGDEPRVGLADFPKPGRLPVRLEAEWRVGLALGNFGDVMAKLFVGLTRVAAAPLGLDHGQDTAARIGQTIIRDAVPRFDVIAVDRNFAANLAAVMQPPAARSWGSIKVTRVLDSLRPICTFRDSLTLTPRG